MKEMGQQVLRCAKNTPSGVVTAVKVPTVPSYCSTIDVIILWNLMAEFALKATGLNGI